MNKTLRLKQAVISVAYPTYYIRQRESVGLSYGCTAFEIKLSATPGDSQQMSIGYSTTEFLIKPAVPPNADETMGLNYALSEFRFQSHPHADVQDTLGIAYGVSDFIVKLHPTGNGAELTQVNYSTVLFEYPGLPSDTLWNPLDLVIPAQILLDDKSTVTNVSGKASAWNDRTSNAFNAEQSAEGNRPIIVENALGNLRTLRFQGGFMSIPGAVEILKARLGGWMFVAIKKNAVDGVPTARRVFSIATNASPTTVPRLALYNSDAEDGSNNKLTALARRTDSADLTVIQSDDAVDDWTFGLVVADYNDGLLSFYVNGVLETQLEEAFPTFGYSSNTDSAEITIAAAGDGSETWEGDIACVLAGYDVPTPSDINRLFGYYAHRYGLTRLLPADHTFKQSPPYATAFAISFNFDGADNGTVFTDASGRVWTVSGSAVTSTAVVKNGTGAYYNPPGYTGYLAAPYSPTLDLSTVDFCIEAWLYPEGNDAANVNATVISKRQGASDYDWCLQRDQVNSRMAFFFGDGSSNNRMITSAVGSVPVNTWTHVAVSRFQGTLSLYINFVRVAMVTVVGDILNRFINVTVGRSLSYSDTNWGGRIDDLKLTLRDAVYYNAAPEEPPGPVDEQGDGVDASKIVLMLHANGSPGSTGITDSSSYSRAMTPVNAAKVSNESVFFGAGAMRLDGSSATRWTAKAHPSLNMYGGAFQIDWRMKLASPLSSTDYTGTVIAMADGTYYIPYEWTVSVGRQHVRFYYGSRGQNQSHIRFFFPGGVDLNFLLKQWNAFSIGRDASGDWGLWINGKRSTSYQVSPLSSGINFGAVTPGVYHNAVNFNDFSASTSGQAMSVGNFFEAGSDWSGYLDELRYVVGSCRDVTQDYNLVTHPFGDPDTEQIIEGDFIWGSVKTLVHFDGADNATTVTDERGRTWTFNGAAKLTRGEKRFGNASLQLNGTDAYLGAVGHADWAFGTDDFTVEMWVKLAATGNGGDRGLFSVGITNGFYCGLQDGKPFVGVNSASHALISDSSIVADVWTHMAYSRKNGTMRIFVNGALAAAGSDTSNYAQAAAFLGARFDPDTSTVGNFVNAYIDDLRVCKGISRYASPFIPYCRLPNAPTSTEIERRTAILLDFEGGSLVDRSAVANAATPYGSPTLTSDNYKRGTQSCRFDGGSAYYFPPGPELVIGEGDYYCEAWLYPTNVGGQRFIFDMRNTSNGANGFAALITDGNLYWSDGAISSMGNTQISANQWSHFLIGRCGGVSYMFLNGVKICEFVDKRNYLNSQLVVAAASYYPIGAAGFIGYMDEFRFVTGVACPTVDFAP